MKPQAARRRGTLLVIVLAVVVMVGGLLTLLATFSAQNYRARQADSARLTGRAISQSAVGYARAHLGEWSAKPPETPVELDVRALLPPNLSGQATIDFPEREGRRVCRVTSSTELGPAGAAYEVILALK